MWHISLLVVHIMLLYLFKHEATAHDKMSPLGLWLRSPEGSLPPKQINNRNSNESFLIHIWKYGGALERRHIRRFQSNKRFSPWEGCSVNNCRLTYNIKDLERSDAVLIPLHWMTVNNAEEIKKLSKTRRHSEQLWIFLTDESPIHTRIYPQYNGIFNWSMNYRIDSDIPVPYGRVIRRKHGNNVTIKFSEIIKKKVKLVTVMGSNCVTGPNSVTSRWEYVKTLSEYIPDQLDIYGKCLNGNATACPGHFAADCPLLDEYKFYLAFENCNCQDYMTEKLFWNAYSKFAVPIIMGASQIDCKRLLPPHSYIHIDDFSSILDLIDYIFYLDLSDYAYLEYHMWRNDFIILNEHGYFGSSSQHYCRICEALHYNPTFPPKTYWNLEKYWNKHNQCMTDNVNFL